MSDYLKIDKEGLAKLPVKERIAAINEIMRELRPLHPIPDAVSFVQWVPLEEVVANDYNPNTVAPPQMRALYNSVWEDGFTMPVVTSFDVETGKYVVVDGFHRHMTGQRAALQKRNFGLLPIVDMQKGDKSDRIVSTLRHNEARGKHQTLGEADCIKLLKEAGLSDEEIQSRLQMDADEVLRLKQATGIADKYREREYSRSWISAKNIEGEDDSK